MRYKRISSTVDNLENLCLNVIVSRMKDFYIEFQLTRTHASIRNFEFLQRAYSDKLYKLLKKKSLLKEQYLDFLINPFWKDVRLHTCSSKFLNATTEKLCVFGAAVTSLNMSCSLASESLLLAIVCCIPNVNRLILCETDCTDKVLKCIRIMCPYLHTLNISYCLSVTNKGVKNLCSTEGTVTNNHMLKNLNVKFTRISKKGISFLLTHLPSLEHLEHEHLSHILYKMHKSDYINSSMEKARKYNLVNFQFQHYQHSKLKHVLGVWLGLCPNVRSLCVHGIQTEYELQLCSKFKKLERVTLMPHAPTPHIRSMSTFFMLKGDTLTELHLILIPISMKSLVLYCHKLKKLFLNTVVFEDFDERDIDISVNKLSSLEEIVIYHDYLSEPRTFKSIRLLISVAENLKKLSLRYVRSFGKDVVDAILSCSPSLSKLDVSFSDIEMSELVKFFSCDKLDEIAVNMCPHISISDHSQLESFSYVSESGCKKWKKNINEGGYDSVNSEGEDGIDTPYWHGY